MSGVLMSLLVTASLAPSWLSVGVPDGEPPVTIIEIPISPTTEPEPATTTTEPATDQPGPTTTLVEQLPSETGEPGTTEPETTEVAPVLVVGGRDWLWIVVAGISLILAILSLRFVRRAFRGPTSEARTGESDGSDNAGTTTSMVPAPSRFEALEYCTGHDLEGSEIYVRTIGEFSSLEGAINAARSARSDYDPDPYPDAWWVVWNTESKHAWWFAEFGNEEESVVDLRSGRRVPYSAQDALLTLSIPPVK